MIENTLTINCIDDIVTIGNTIIEDKRVVNGTALSALEKVVENTPYKVGNVEGFENNNINFYFISSLTGLNNIINTYECEFKTRIVINDLGKIEAKYIDLVHRLGKDTGLRFTYDTNVNSIERTTSDEAHFNVLYGRGKSLETDDGGYSRKLTFADVVWSTPGNPINKPSGQRYIEDAESIAKYGRLEGIYENDNIEDATLLLQATYDKLQKVKNLGYSYTVDVDDLRSFKGFEHYKYTFGDSIIVLDEDENITVEARILAVNTDVDLEENTKSTKITLGNFRNGLIENEDDIKDVIDNIKDQLGNIGDSEINDTDFPDTLPDAPIITGKGLFATIMLEWTYENKLYYTYEIFASKIKDFAPGTTNRIYEGKASAFLHEVNPEETWYYRARAKNTHNHYTDYSSQLIVSTYKISDSANYFEEAAIKDATIGELKLDRGWVGKLVGTHIDARNLTVTDGNGNKTLDIDSFGRVNLDVTEFKIKSENVDTYISSKVEQNIGDIGTDIGSFKEEIEKEVGDISKSLEAFKITVDGTFKDGIINEVEADSLKKQIELLKVEKADIDSIYDTIYMNMYLVDSYKTNLYSAKNKYNTAHTTLIDTIIRVIVDGVITDSENTEVSTAFTNYATALGNYKKYHEQAIDSISEKRKQEAISDSNSYTTSQLKINKDSIMSEVSKTYITNTNASNAFSDLDKNLQNNYASKTLVTQTADSISSEVSKKVGKTEIISSINQTAESVKINASKINLNGYVTVTDLATSGKTTINGGNLNTCNISAANITGKSMVYIQQNGTLSCDGNTYIRDFFVPETHPNWSSSSRGSFRVVPVGQFDKGIQVGGEVLVANSSGKYIGVIRRSQGAFVEVDRIGVQQGGGNTYLEIVGYNSNHVYGVNLWYSDKKLKENIEEINTEIIHTNNDFPLGLDLINKLKHYSFNFKEELGGNKVDCGYIAQQLQEVNPGLVNEVKQADGDTILQPVESYIIPNLTLALQQQQKMIEDLQARIEKLEKGDA